MRKTILMGAAMWMASNLAFAGGYLTNTNQHISFLRMLARGASTEIDAVYSNPAGLAFLESKIACSPAALAALNSASATLR